MEYKKINANTAERKTVLQVGPIKITTLEEVPRDWLLTRKQQLETEKVKSDTELVGVNTMINLLK